MRDKDFPWQKRKRKSIIARSVLPEMLKEALQLKQKIG